ncbi:MAG: hypothetical protein DMF98_25295 [Acidobacteria bacterium]|nr:MAG: hypothetical protein DMF98_25295 [Acidobacteriota bacterium]
MITALRLASDSSEPSDHFRTQAGLASLGDELEDEIVDRLSVLQGFGEFVTVRAWARPSLPEIPSPPSAGGHTSIPSSVFSRRSPRYTSTRLTRRGRSAMALSPESSAVENLRWA